MANTPRQTPIKGKPLTELAVKAAKPHKTAYKLTAGDGLFLLVKPMGGKYWRYKYRFGGSEKLLALGVYPEVSLKEAREKRDDARLTLRNGGDPANNKKEQKRLHILQAANTFEAIAREWHEKRREDWSESHAERIIGSLEKDIFPHLGNRPIEQIIPCLLGFLGGRSVLYPPATTNA